MVCSLFCLIEAHQIDYRVKFKGVSELFPTATPSQRVVGHVPSSSMRYYLHLLTAVPLSTWQFSGYVEFDFHSLAFRFQS